MPFAKARKCAKCGGAIYKSKSGQWKHLRPTTGHKAQ